MSKFFKKHSIKIANLIVYTNFLLSIDFYNLSKLDIICLVSLLICIILFIVNAIISFRLKHYYE